MTQFKHTVTSEDDGMEVRQITVSKLGSDGVFQTEPSPWLITGTTMD